MANNKLSGNENILVKIDQNNLIYIDPSSVVSEDGTVEKRDIKPENLVTYVNLEADIIPRTILASVNDKSTLSSIAKGTLNFLKNQNGSDYDTTWTDSFLNYNQNSENGKLVDSFNQGDKSAQTLGIKSINILIKGANFIPQVTIDFVDVRGKTLFEAPDDSPYNAFFHLPWPIFYLTVKGFYGQAIRYRLHLVKFSSRYNEASGNFEITTVFVGSTYAWMNDIPLKGVLYAPYMYAFDMNDQPVYNSNTGDYNVKVKKSARGYELLKSVYANYKELGLLDPNFPVKTLKELVVIAKSLDKILEKQIFSDNVNGINPNILQALKQGDELINQFQAQINSWKAQYTSIKTVTINGTVYSYFSPQVKDKTNTEYIVGADKDGYLENIIAFNNKGITKINELINNAKNQNKNIPDLHLGLISDIKNYYTIDTQSTKQVVIAINKLADEVNGIAQKFNEKKQTILSYLEEIINNFIKNPANGIGFAPTIRNIFAVILANAEVYVELMKETHQRAYQVGPARKLLLKNYSFETKNDENIYPWPEVRKKSSGNKQWVIAYPAGSQDMITQLQSDNKQMWPEVDFLENYYKINTLMVDPTGGIKEGSISNVNFTFDSNLETNNTKKVGSISTILYSIPYSNENPTSILYEIWERSYYLTFLDSFDVDTLTQLSKIEFKNLTNVINNNTDDNTDLIDLLNNTTIQNITDFVNQLESHSKYKRYPYLQDQLPTVKYLDDVVYKNPYKLEQYIPSNLSTNNDQEYDKLSKWLRGYVVEDYRTYMYPFISGTYKGYLNDNDYKPTVSGLSLKVNTTESFICSPINPFLYVKEGFSTNLFNRKINIKNNVGTISANILNTPYFHNQLYYDFVNNNNYGKYVGSAYLLLNSLPFHELLDSVSFNSQTNDQFQTPTNSNLLSLFKEVGSTHFIPYHLIVKWGSIYHRYKRKILDGVDILAGFLTTGNTTTTIDGKLFFDNNDTRIPENVFQIGTDFVSYTNKRDLGIHPFYDAIFHQIVNGYDHYDVFSGSTSFEDNLIAGAIKELKSVNGSLILLGTSAGQTLNYWTQYVDNSKFGDGQDLRYTILPSCAYNNVKQFNKDTFSKTQENYFRIIWDDDQKIVGNYSGVTFNSYKEYTLSELGDYDVKGIYRKTADLIATFSPTMLDDFESIFLDFASDVGTISNTERVNQRFSHTKYTHFQTLLRDMVSFSTITPSSDAKTIISEIKKQQPIQLSLITRTLLSNDNLVKLTITNPKEIDPHVLFGFTKTTITGTYNNTLTFNGYDLSQDVNKKYIELYVGEDFDGWYIDFFRINNIELNEENVLSLKTLILMYAGYGWLIQSTPTPDDFKSYVIDEVLNKGFSNGLGGFTQRFGTYLDLIINQFGTLKKSTIQEQSTYIVNGFNNEPLKIDMYNNFKSFNDKWVAGNSIGQRTLMEEFLFLDRANKDIGDELFLDITKLISMVEESNLDTNLYSAISELIMGSGLDMRPLPAYVNFYGTNYNNTKKVNASQKTASDLFGTFLEVDCQSASPKIVIQYVGENSKYLSNNSSDNTYNDDSFDCSMVNNNPLIITTSQAVTLGDLTKSNKAVSFEISFGDQNQGIFKSITLNQATIRNTAASSYVLEAMARSSSGANAVNIDVSLYDYYRTAAYSCEVTMLGDVMIQPTMFFYLKNVPMFKGTYWILEVSHDIKNNQVITTFKGARMPMGAFPDPKDSFASSYKTLFDKLTNAASSIVTPKKEDTQTSKTILDPINGHLTYDYQKVNSWENDKMFNESEGGITQFGVPYNGFSLFNNNDGRFVIQIKYKNQTWLRAKAVRMGGSTFKAPGTDTGDMLVLNGLSNSSLNINWVDLDSFSNKSYFYSLRYQIKPPNTYDIILNKSKCTFYNPKLDRTIPFDSKFTTSNGKISTISGPVDLNVPDNYGIALSAKLMSDLGLNEGDFVYFNVG
jgi:hypothetical protein